MLHAGAVFFSSGYILSQIIGDELLEQLQPHRRVKRREKILPGWSSSQIVEAAVQHGVKIKMTVYSFLDADSDALIPQLLRTGSGASLHTGSKCHGEEEIMSLMQFLPYLNLFI